MRFERLNFLLLTAIVVLFNSSLCFSERDGFDRHFMPTIDVTNDLIKTDIYEKNVIPGPQDDHTKAIQAAINYVSQKGGGVVYLPQGQYNVARINIIDGVKFVGEGRGKTIVRSLSDSELVLIVGKHVVLQDMTLYGTRPEGSGDNWNVGTGGIGKGGTATAFHNISVRDGAENVVIDNIESYESRYDTIYIRTVRGLKVYNSRFDRAGRNILSIVGTTEDFIFSNCYFGSYWGLYHADIEHSGDKCINNGTFINCVFNGSNAGDRGTDTWGAFFCFSGHHELKNYNVSLFGCEFQEIYIRVRGIFPDVRFINNKFENKGPVFVKIRDTKGYGAEFQNIEVRNNKFLKNGKPNINIVSNVAFTGDSTFKGNFPDCTNMIDITQKLSNSTWAEDHPIANAEKLKKAKSEVERKGDITIVHMPTKGYSLKFDDNCIIGPSELKKMQLDNNKNSLSDIIFHSDPFICLEPAGIQFIGQGTLESFSKAPKNDYSLKLFGAQAGSVYAVRTRDNKFILMEVTSLDSSEVKFKYKYVD